MVVGIKEGDEAAARFCDANIASNRWPAVLRQANDGRPRRRDERCDCLSRIHGRVVIDDDRFPVGENLVKQHEERAF